MATRTATRAAFDPDDDDFDPNEYDHDDARKYSELVHKNQTKRVRESEKKVWKHRLEREQAKIDTLCTKIHGRTGKRYCIQEKYKDKKGMNLRGLCRQHFYEHNTKMRKEKKEQNASHPIVPVTDLPHPPPPISVEFFSQTALPPATSVKPSEKDTEDELTLRLKRLNPNFKVNSIVDNNNTSDAKESEERKKLEEQRRKKFAEEQAAREKEIEERLRAEIEEKARRRIDTLLKTMEDRWQKELGQRLFSSPPDARQEAPRNETPDKDKDGDEKMSELSNEHEEEEDDLSEIEVER